MEEEKSAGRGVGAEACFAKVEYTRHGQGVPRGRRGVEI